jgi:hypothetical protein
VNTVSSVVLASALVAAGAPPLPYWSHGQLVAVPADAAKSIGVPHDDPLAERVQALLLPPEALVKAYAIETLIPATSRLVAVTVEGPAWIVRLELPADFLENQITEGLLERLSRQLDLAFPDRPDLLELHLVARPLGSQDPWKALPAWLSIEPVPEKEGGRREQGSGIRDPSEKRRVGAVRRSSALGGAGLPLDGMVIFLSQCHGWIDYDDSREWSTQRGITHGIVEDFVNPEAVNQYLIEYLENAGAMVLTARERDLQTAMVIVDESDPVPAYVESGNPGAFANSGQLGFDHPVGPWSASADPFAGGTARLMTTTATETARATWTPTIPSAGFYAIYVSYTRDGAARASDAHYIVRHSGGDTHLRVDQERHGWTWIPLGTFHFEAGSDPAQASVSLANDSAEVGDTVSLDAVRFGGGMGDILGQYHGTVSTHPRWEEGARTYVQYLGAPASVWGSGDVAARSRWADWEHFADEDSLYLSWHSNAFNGSARGTTTYIYSSNPPDGTWDPNQAVPGSAELADTVHDEIVADVRALWEAGWQDRGLRSAYFGEVNPAHNDEMPSVLLEVAFHDNATDAQFLAHPRFRRDLARAIAQGIVKWVADRDQVPVALLPEPPAAPEVHATEATSALVTWDPSPTDGASGDPATGYRLFRSPNGYGFDEGVDVVGTSFALTGLSPGEPTFVRLAATNAGGQSLLGETLMVRPLASGPRALIVHAFDRLDRGVLVSQPEPDLGGTVLRMFLDRINAGRAGVPHAEALDTLGVGFDATSNEALLTGRVPLDPTVHPVVVWVLGEESTADETFSSAEQSLVEAYLGAGGRLIVSGAEIGWDLDWLGSAADRTFFRGVLGARYLADDGGTAAVEPTNGGVLDGIAPFSFDDGTGTPIEYPDVLDAEPGNTTCLLYQGTSSPACVISPQVVVLGFPFEGITPSSTRDQVLARLLDALRIPGWQLFADGFESGDSGAWSAVGP